MKVLKFGGGCLRDAAGFERAAALAAAESPSAAVVVSAVYGVTDLLVNAAAAAAALKSSDSAFMPALRDLHVRIAEEALKSRSLRPRPCGRSTRSATAPTGCCVESLSLGKLPRPSGPRS